MLESWTLPRHSAAMRNSDGAERVRRFLRAQRKTHGWSQTDLAAKASVARNTVAALERGMALREGNEGAIEEALGLPLGAIEDVRRGRREAVADETDDRQAEPVSRNYSSDDLELAILLARRGLDDEEILRVIDRPPGQGADQLSVEPPTGTDR
jgi:transcriptional regulator with XRE-family HTH domain